MEICQSCSKKIESWERVSFGVIGGVTRSWVLCELCADKLQDMVLGYMGELPPEQGSPESLGEYGIFADGTFVDGDGRFITAQSEEQSCETCRGYSPLLFGCTKRTQSGSESCRRHGFAWWEPKETLGDTAWFEVRDGELRHLKPCHWKAIGSIQNCSACGFGSNPSFECFKMPGCDSKEPEPNGTAGEDYTAWFDEEQDEEPNNGTVLKVGTVTKNAVGGWDIEGWSIDMTDANTGVAAIHVDQDNIVRICGKTLEELPFTDEPCPGYYGESRDRELSVAEEPPAIEEITEVLLRDFPNGWPLSDEVLRDHAEKVRETMNSGREDLPSEDPGY